MISGKERQILLVVLAIGLVVLALLSLPQLPRDWSSFAMISGLWRGLAEAVTLLLVGHALRAEKMVLLLRPLHPHCRFAVYRCLAIGYLYNLILPLRAGELIRAHLLGRQLMISRTATLLTIVFERVIDSILLSGLMIAVVVQGGSSIFEITAIIKFIIIGVFLIAGLWMLLRPRPWLLAILRNVTNIFNDRYRDTARWSIWSGVRFLQIVLRRGNWLAYAMLSLLMWTAYVLSMVVAVKTVTGVPSLATAIACFISAILPAGSINLAAYMQGFEAVAPLHMPVSDIVPLLAIVTWAVLMLPMSLLGLLFMFAFRPLSPLEQAMVSDDVHKLTRHGHMPSELSAFMENYFGGSRIAQVIDEMEAAGQCRNLRIFTGGSNAVTMLVGIGDKMRVRKIAPTRFDAKLDAQKRWLEAHKDSPLFAQVQNDFVVGNSHIIDIEYRADFVPFYEEIHRSDASANTALLQKLLEAMQQAVWRDAKPVYNPEGVRAYIQKKVIQKITDAAGVHPEIQSLASFDTLIINGVEYPNLETSLQRIKSDTTILRDLATYQEGDVHGDLTVDNILANGTELLVVDPNNENDVSDMIVDIAKLYQSLHSGYEFLRQLAAAQVDGNIVKFAEQRSNQYDDLFRFLDGRMVEILPPNRYRAILFHEAVHYCRMLTYRVTLNPATASAFYAVAVRLFSQFVVQYDRRDAGVEAG